MAYETIPSGDIVAGKPTKQEIFTKTRANFEDHESRITSAESALQTFFPITFKVQGSAELYVPVTGLLYQRIFNDISLTSCRIFVPTAGASGTTEVDVQYKRGGGAFGSIFSTKPSLAYSAGNYSLSSNAVFGVTDLLAGDILRLDIVTSQVDCPEFDVYLTFEAA